MNITRLNASRDMNCAASHEQNPFQEFRRVDGASAHKVEVVPAHVFTRTLRNLLKQEGSRPHNCSIVHIVIEDLDQVCSLFGHEISEQAYQSLGELISQHIGIHDCAGRLEDNRFGILFVNMCPDLVKLKANHLISLMRSHPIMARDIRLSVPINYVHMPITADSDLTELIDCPVIPNAIDAEKAL